MNNLAEVRLSTRHNAVLFKGRGGHASIFGFECLDGWEDLLDGVLHLAQTYAVDAKLNLQITSAKEKFGTLRFSHQGGDEIIDLAFDVTELVSSRICEICGKKGNVIDSAGWLQTRCADHIGQDLEITRKNKSTDSEYVVNYVRTLALLLWFFKGDALRWSQEENLALGKTKPYEAMASTNGCAEVYLLIKRLTHGVGV